MHRMIYAATVALMITLASSASAEWALVYEAEGIHFYIDPATIRKTGNLGRVWTVQNLRAKGSHGELSRRVLFEIDCKQERWRTANTSLHLGQMASGTIVLVERDPGNWLNVPPGTFAEHAFGIVCRIYGADR